MRDRIVASLPDVAHREFLVYLMGPYKAFGPDDLADAGVGPPAVDDDSPVDGSPPEGEDPHANEDQGGGASLPPDANPAGHAEPDVFGLLERVRDRLRDDAGLGAFLAVDVGVPLDQVDAATQTVGFARASNVVALVVPHVGKNLGVGIETGVVLEALDDTERERVVFVHEEGVRSAMIAAVSRRWEATVYAYDDEDELVARLRMFATDVMHRELTGDLPRLDSG